MCTTSLQEGEACCCPLTDVSKPRGRCRRGRWGEARRLPRSRGISRGPASDRVCVQEIRTHVYAAGFEQLAAGEEDKSNPN